MGEKVDSRLFIIFDIKSLVLIQCKMALISNCTGSSSSEEMLRDISTSLDRSGRSCILVSFFHLHARLNNFELQIISRLKVLLDIVHASIPLLARRHCTQ